MGLQLGRLAALLVAILAVWSGVAAGPGLPIDPRATPSLPAEPPPPIPAGPAAERPGSAATALHEVNVVQGWSIVAFPYGTVVKVEGLSHMVLRLDQGGFTPVDPVHHPEALTPGLAYLAWAPQAEVMRVHATAGPIPSTRLHPGWNLLGNPAGQDLPTGSFTLTRPGGATRLVTETASPSLTPGGGWLFSVAGGYGPQGQVRVDLRAPRALLPAGAVGWIFAWTDVDWNWNAAPPPSRPTIASVQPNPAAPGTVVKVLGRGFGEAGRGEVTVGGVTVPYSAWSDQEIRFTLPKGAGTGGVVVMKERFPSGSMALQVAARAPSPQAPAAPKAGALAGKVVDASGKPLANALVALENGQQALTGKDGSFRIADVPVGQHVAYISLVGYRTGNGQVTVEAGKTRSMGVKLSPVQAASASASAAPAAAAEKSTTMTVKCWAFTSSGVRVWPKAVEVWESGNSSRYWKDVWWEDRGDNYRELRCPGVLVGRSYVIRVMWSTKAGGERTGRWEKRIWKEDQVEDCERPN